MKAPNADAMPRPIDAKSRNFRRPTRLGYDTRCLHLAQHDSWHADPEARAMPRRTLHLHPRAVAARRGPAPSTWRADAACNCAGRSNVGVAPAWTTPPALTHITDSHRRFAPCFPSVDGSQFGSTMASVTHRTAGHPPIEHIIAPHTLHSIWPLGHAASAATASGRGPTSAGQGSNGHASPL